MAITLATAVATSQSFTSSYVVTAPSSVANNDVVLVYLLVVGSGGYTFTPPSGFTEKTPRATSGGLALAVFWKRSTGSEPSTYTFGINAGSTMQAIAVKASGVVTSGTPFDVSSASTSFATGPNPPNVSCTPTNANELVTYFTASTNSVFTNTYVPQSGFTNFYLVKGSNPPANFAVDTLQQTSAAATGNVAGTWTGDTGDVMAGWIGALTPAAGGGGGSNSTNFFAVL